MKSLNNVLCVMALFGFCCFSSGIVFAQKDSVVRKDASARNVPQKTGVQILIDAANALQASDPVLAAALKKFMSDNKPGSPEWREKRDERIKLLQDAAAALAQTQPVLAREIEARSRRMGPQKGMQGTVPVPVMNEQQMTGVESGGK